MQPLNRRGFLASLGGGALALSGSRSVAKAAQAAPNLPAPNSAPAPSAPFLLPFRQVHLDFHTSPLIPEIGADFDPEEFVQILKEASVNSVTVFAKCHHGMSYYPTKVGVRHPHLSFDLLGETIEACRRAGIQTPVYMSAAWDEAMADLHPDWLVRDESGRPDGPGPLQAGWRRLCLHTPYMDYLAAQTEELVRGYDADGLFFDIMRCSDSGCLCPHCRQDLLRQGRDPAQPDHRRQHALEAIQTGMKRLASIVRQHRPRAGIFFNSRTRPGIRSELEHFTHLELESLPGGAWGYLHFQIMSRHARTLGRPIVGMTGRFHRSWGDFGTIRNQAALDYECFSMLAQGALCSIGDQLHPRGRLDPAVYQRIGRTYRSVADKEPWCQNARPRTEIGLWLATPDRLPIALAESDQGAARMLIQLHQQFDALDPSADLQPYPVLILPDSHRLDAAQRGRLQDYLRQGGKLLLSHQSGLDPDGLGFALPQVGLDYHGPAADQTEYVEALPDLDPDLSGMIQVSYEPAVHVSPQTGTRILARLWQSYFDRNYLHFSSHRQTPVSRPTEFAAITERGPVIYLSMPVFRAYARHSRQFDKLLAAACLRRLLPRPLVRCSAPSTAHVTVTQQPGRQMVHLLHYPAERRAPDLDIVEDVIPLVNIDLALRLDRAPARAYLAPQRQPLPLSYRDGYACVAVPEVRGHQIVVFETAT